jgi:hypothetical protein
MENMKQMLIDLIENDDFYDFLLWCIVAGIWKLISDDSCNPSDEMTEMLQTYQKYYPDLCILE